MSNSINENSTTVIPKENLQSAANNNTVKGVLTRVYKFFMVSFGKDRTPVWNKLMENFINDPVNNIPNSRNKQTSAKGNMKREYLGSQLSWPKFCEAMRFAKFKKLEIIFIVEDENGQRMKMCEELDFQTMDDADFDPDLLESRVRDVSSAGFFEQLEEPDAREQAKRALDKKSKKPIANLGKTSNWVNRQPSDIQDIIKNNTVK